MTGDYSLDDFLDAGEREDPDDAEERDDGPAEPDDGPESAADAGAPADVEPSADSPTDDVEAESSDVDPASADETPIPPGTVAPVEPTYGWSPDGAECAGCGGTATTRWRQDGEYVCADCKEW